MEYKREFEVVVRFTVGSDSEHFAHTKLTNFLGRALLENTPQYILRATVDLPLKREIKTEPNPA